MPWTAFIDGGSRGNPGPGGAGIQISDEGGKIIFAGGFFLGRITNNQAEYQGLLRALDIFSQAGAQDIMVFSDSELLVRQVNGQYAVKSAPLRRLYAEVQQKLAGFNNWEIQYVPRDQNRVADRLVNKALNAGRDVLIADVLGLSDKQIDRSKVRGRTGKPSGGASTVEVFVLKSPAKQGCPAKMKRGQLFVFDKVVPAGFCIQACVSVADAVLALQESGADLLSASSNMTVRCPKDDCGAVFEIRWSSS
ncbi:MAG: ribonuclease HI family protein [Planctomycetota bacterium]|jgi:uncharacterized repeat protein (TIGR04076 family)